MVGAEVFFVEAVVVDSAVQAVRDITAIVVYQVCHHVIVIIIIVGVVFDKLGIGLFGKYEVGAYLAHLDKLLKGDEFHRSIV